MPTSFPRPGLRPLLAVDAAFCLASATLLIFAAGPLAQLTALPAPLLFWAGLLLVPCAAFMGWLARSATPPRWGAVTLVAGNALWVVASLALPLTGLVDPNALGWAFLLIQALVVAGLAWLEHAATPAGTARAHPAGQGAAD